VKTVISLAIGFVLVTLAGFAPEGFKVAAGYLAGVLWCIIRDAFVEGV